MKKILVLFLSVFTSLALWGQVEEARRITQVLCSDSLYGRGYVNDGVGKAARFLAHEFQQAGLQPYLKEGFLQDFEFSVNSFPGEMHVFLDHQELQPGLDYVVDAISGSFSGKLDYFVLNADDLSDEAKLEAVLNEVTSKKGKNAVYIDTRGLPLEEERKIHQHFLGFAQYAPTLFTTQEKFTWSVGRQQLPYPAIYIQDSVFATGIIEVAITAKFEQTHVSSNVIGWLPAKKKTKKTLLFCAHYDHLGGMGQAAYFPGANDNASGTAMLLSLANHYVKHPSQYNLMFVAFAGEEAGLLGSTHFVAKETIPLKQLVKVLNLDIMGSGDEGITVVNGKVHQKNFNLLTQLNEEHGYLPLIKARGETQNSDHFPFHQKGVPSFFIYTMGENKNYHDVFDTYENLTFYAYNNIVQLLISFVERL